LLGQRLAKRLACDNNGEMSLVARNDNIYGQLTPFFNFLEAVDVEDRHAFFSTLVTGPMTSPIDNSMVISVSFPTVARVSNNESV
jgi:hypothetical protein